MSMLIGFGIFSANKAVAVTRERSALAVDIFMKRRRSIEAYSACRASVPDAIGVPQKRPTMGFVTRREAAKIIGSATAGLMLPADASRAQANSGSSAMLTRTIPFSGEKLPVIGLGTWR